MMPRFFSTANTLRRLQRLGARIEARAGGFTNAWWGNNRILLRGTGRSCTATFLRGVLTSQMCIKATRQRETDYTLEHAIDDLFTCELEVDLREGVFLSSDYAVHARVVVLVLVVSDVMHRLDDLPEGARNACYAVMRGEIEPALLLDAIKHDTEILE